MTTNFIFDIYFTLPELYLVISIFVLLVFGVLVSGSKNLGYPLISKVTGLISIQILILTFILLIWFPYFNFFSWNYFFTTNLFVLSSKVIIIISSILWTYFSITYIITEKVNSYEYWILILLAVLALLCLLQVYDLLTLYLLIEFQSLSFYVLASFNRTSEFSTEAGLKYFVLGAFASAFLLFGSSIIYGFTGLTNFADLNTFFTGFIKEDLFSVSGTLVGLIFILSALLFKLTAAPFHMWAPDVYEGSPTSTTAFFAIFPKLVIITLLLRIFFLSFHDFFSTWKYLFLLCSFLSLLFGSLGALAQKNEKRFLAYSSINHIGYILIGFLLGEPFGIISIILYLIIYIITSFAIFSFLISLRLYEYPQWSQIRYLNEVTGLSKTNPLLALSLLLILFSMAGIPPLSGFFAKVFILLSGVRGSAYGLVLIAVILSSISCFYYIRIIQLTYFSNLKKWPLLYPIEKSTSLVLGSSCYFLLFFFWT
uniref:NADH dehydrogenase subunit 2 n=1 Tax=Calliarthron tuberculosum TaxID=48942 RepID=A0A0F7C9R0_CALTB|nr:NADH dehydrogenase subunit 2 [Calliarthron tuberculosum]AKG26274.1 NADH dehydrogenase subunit 2 [Calliarthron tuberculosum]